MVSWLKSSSGSICINGDNSSISNLSAISNLGVASFGGLVRDNCENFIHDFHGFLWVTDVIDGEIMGLLQGLSICWDMGVSKLVRCSNSFHVLQLVRDGNQD